MPPCGPEQRRQLALATVELLCEPARPDEQPDLAAVGPQWDQHHRSHASARRARGTSSWSCRAARRPPTVDPRRATPGARRRRAVRAAPCAPLGRLDELAVSSSSSSWLVSIGSTRPSDRTATSGSPADHAASSCRRTGGRVRRGRRYGTSAARRRRARAPERAAAPTSAPTGRRHGRLDVDHADDARCGQQRDREPPRRRRGGCRRSLGRCATSSASCVSVVRTARPIDALLERETVGHHRVAAHTDRPQPAVLEHESGDAGPAEPIVKPSSAPSIAWPSASLPARLREQRAAGPLDTRDSSGAGSGTGDAKLSIPESVDATSRT